MAATEVASAAFPSKSDQPMRAAVLAPEEVQDLAERAAATSSVDGDARFEQVFGVSWDDYSADHLG